MSEIIKPGKRFGGNDTLAENGGSWKRDVYDKVVKKTRRNLVPYNDINRVLMFARGDIEKAQNLIDKKQIPSNPDVMLDFYNRLCDLEEVVVKLCAVASNQLGYDANCRSEEN